MLLPFMRRCGRFIRCERAVSALEYAILAAVIIGGIGTAIAAFSNSMNTSIDTLATSIGTGMGEADDDIDLDVIP